MQNFSSSLKALMDRRRLGADNPVGQRAKVIREEGQRRVEDRPRALRQRGMLR